MRVLVTGGTGFIGSNLVEELLNDPKILLVRVLDNLATGTLKNIESFFTDKRFHFVEGDIRDFNTCLSACDGIDYISHQAALGSVPRSINDPLTTNDVNITGTLNIFTAAKEKAVKRVVYAASSSTYGDHPGLPKVEDTIGNPLSPYAVTKYVNELYADVFARTYGLDFIGLRYFNVFGRRQDPDGAYAAVIPLFFKAAIQNISPVINGDGNFSRDFTYIDNAIEANLLSLFTEDINAINQIYNVACGEQISLNKLWTFIKEIAESSIDAIHGPHRTGDIAHSLADVSKGKSKLGYTGAISVEEGLKRAYNFYKIESGHA